MSKQSYVGYLNTTDSHFNTHFFVFRSVNTHERTYRGEIEG
jgi:hypothetical protein